MRRLTFALIVVMGLVGEAGAQVTGRIVGPGATRLEVAISPLAESGESQGLGARFAEIVARNLTLCGYFKILDPKAYIEGPTPIEPAEINFANWATIGAKALTKGTVNATGGGIEVEARIFDVAQRIQIGGARYSGNANDLPRIARRFADRVMEYVTGEVGPFDSKIAFISRRGGRFKDVLVMSVDGFDVSPVTSSRTIQLAPSWAPDTQSLLFTSFQDGNASLYRYDFASRAMRKLSSATGFNLGGHWSPDGRFIALSIERGGNSDIFLLDSQGQMKQQLTKGPEIDVSPSWSPDGQKIAWVSSRAGNPQVYMMNSDGSGERRVTFQGGYNTSPNWSPKGDMIAYVGREGGFNVYTVNLGNNQVRQLTSGQRNNEDPTFSPDGRYLVFSSTRGGKPALFLADLSGTHQVQLTSPGGDDTSPSWSPRLP